MKGGIVAMLLIAAALPALAGPSARRQAELQHMLEHDCGSCHGMTRQGGLGLPLTPEALTDTPAEALAAAILDGRPGTPMPPWRGLLSDDDADWLACRLKGNPNAC